MNDLKLHNLKFSHEMSDKVLSFFDSSSQLDELAKNSIIPHFRLLNPITKETKYLFEIKKIYEYLSKNCISEIEGKKLTVLSFGDKYLPYKESHNLPHELKGVSNDVYNLPLAYIDSPSGVYFLYHEEELVYIGKATNVSGRIVNHLREKLKDFNKVYFIRVDLESLNRVERDLIRKFKPKYNKTFKK